MDAEAREKMAFWALSDINDENILLTFVELTSDWNKRGIVTFSVSLILTCIGFIRYHVPNHNFFIASFNNRVSARTTRWI